MSFRLLLYVIQKRRFILWVTVAFFLVSFIYVMIAGAKYESKALLMPPLEQSTEGLIAARMAQLNLPAMVIPVTPGATSASVLADILGSRRLAVSIIEALDLQQRYKANTMDDALRELWARRKILVTNTGLITISIKDKEPQMAETIVWYHISGLDSLNRYLQFTRAARTMEFISGQMERYKMQLGSLRDEMAAFQEEHGIVDFDEQVKGAIEVASELKVRTILAQIERDLLQEFAMQDAIELRRKDAEYENLAAQLNQIMEGDSSEAVFFSLRRLPELYQRFASLQRDLEVNERIYSYLLQRYEEAGIDKARNTPAVYVIDEPNLPEKPAGLPRWVVVLIVSGIGFVWGSVMFAWLGWLGGKERDEREERALQGLAELAKQDLRKLRSILKI
jgi:uncharacterized protein involved in exopolysaccharide biosynthesis